MSSILRTLLTSLADPVAAWLALGLSSSLLENLLDVGPSGVGSTGHEGRTVSGTLLTTRDTGTDKQETLGLELLGSSDRVWVVRVTTVNDNVTFLEEWLELSDKVIDGLTGLDEEDDSSRSLELLAELLNRVSTDNVGSLGLVGEEVVDLGSGSAISNISADRSNYSPVVSDNLESLVVHVEDQVLTL